MFKDAHGDVLSIYTSTSNKAADYTYDAWGEIQTKNESSSFENNPLRYYGQYYDYESDMTYLRARYYDSSIKRFITEDPAKDGSNWYAYCGNNPVMLFDPSGLDYYIFYGKDRTDASKSTEKQLNEKYPDKKVHRILVENEEDFIKIGMLWVSMKMEMKWILMEFLFISMEVQIIFTQGKMVKYMLIN